MKQRPKHRGIEPQNEFNTDNKNIIDEIELSKRNYTEIRTTEIVLKEDDTLQALAIRYRCPIAELKRLNNLHRENEIYARRTIKIPSLLFSMAAVHKSGENSPDSNLKKKNVDVCTLQEILSTVSSFSKELDNSTGTIVHDLVDISDHQDKNDFNKIIFNTTINHADQFEVDEADFSTEEVQLIPNTRIVNESSTNFNCSGADWGLSWPVLLAIILLVAFIGPIIYIFYIAEHPEKYHHHHS